MAATKLNRSSDIVWEQLGEQALLVRPASHESWTLSGAAMRVWMLCDGTRDLREIVETFRSATSQTLSRAQTEIAAIQGQLVALGLLHGTPLVAGNAGQVAHFSSGLNSITPLRSLGVGASSRRRPSPRGNSGPG